MLRIRQELSFGLGGALRGARREVPQIQYQERVVEVPQVQYIENVVEKIDEKRVEIAQVQYNENVGEKIDKKRVVVPQVRLHHLHHFPCNFCR